MIYGQGGEVIEIIIRDNSGAKMETYKFKLNDKRVNHLFNNIKKKYGIEDDNKDLNWLKRNRTW